MSFFTTFLLSLDVSFESDSGNDVAAWLEGSFDSIPAVTLLFATTMGESKDTFGVLIADSSPPSFSNSLNGEDGLDTFHDWHESSEGANLC